MDVNSRHCCLRNAKRDAVDGQDRLEKLVPPQSVCMRCVDAVTVCTHCPRRGSFQPHMVNRWTFFSVALFVCSTFVIVDDVHGNLVEKCGPAATLLRSSQCTLLWCRCIWLMVMTMNGTGSTSFAKFSMKSMCEMRILFLSPRRRQPLLNWYRIGCLISVWSGSLTV